MFGSIVPMRSVSLLLLAVALAGCALFVPKFETPRLAIVDEFRGPDGQAPGIGGC